MSAAGSTIPTAVALGRCDEVRAEVFLRAGAANANAIAGTLTGPQRGRDTTLPVTARLQPTATPGVVRAIVTEPAYWTPDLPNLYRLQATIATSGDSPVTVDRLIGLRRLGVRGRSLWLDGHRWVPRAMRVEDIAGIDPCKPAALAALVTDPDEATLARADAIGVAVIPIVPATATDPVAIADRVAAWAGHPSAVLAIVPDDMPAATVAEIASAVRPVKDTLLLAVAAPGKQPAPATIPPGIDALVVALDACATPHESWRAGAPVPLLAWRRESTTPAAGRAPCDALQAALAAWGTAGGRDIRSWDWAGYIVGEGMHG